MLMTTTMVHTDIHEKKVYYLKITNGTNVQFVNVNERIYNKVNELETSHLDSNQHVLPFEGINPKITEHGEENITGTEGSTEQKLEVRSEERRPRHGRADK